MAITLKELPSGAKAACPISTYECDLCNETNRQVRVYICNPEWLHVYLMAPKTTMKKIHVVAGANALCAFDVDARQCLEARCFDLSGPASIFIQ